MPQPPELPPPVLPYAPRRPRFGMHWPTFSVGLGLMLAANLWPHFTTGISPRIADDLEDLLGWPWPFLWFGGYGGGYVWREWHLLMDAALAVAIPVTAGYLAARLRRTKRKSDHV